MASVDDLSSVGESNLLCATNQMFSRQYIGDDNAFSWACADKSESQSQNQTKAIATAKAKAKVKAEIESQSQTKAKATMPYPNHEWCSMHATRARYPKSKNQILKFSLEITMAGFAPKNK